MLKLERYFDGERTTVRLIGRVRSEYLGEITNQMRSCGPKVTLDLKDVMAVDLKIVRLGIIFELAQRRRISESQCLDIKTKCKYLM